MFATLAISVVCVFLLAVPGLVGRRQGWITRTGTYELSNLVVNAIYPCLIFSSIYRNYSMAELRADWALPAVSFGIMVLGFLVGGGVARLVAFRDGAEQRAFVYQSTMNNYSFLPLALVLTLYGEHGEAKLLLSTLGGEVAAWTLGISILSGQVFRAANLRHLVSPPLVALYLAVICRAWTDRYGLTGMILEEESGALLPSLFLTVHRVGLVAVPAALTVAGSRMAGIHPKGLAKRRLWLLAGLRLVVIPVIAVFLIRLLPLPQLSRHVMMIVAVMPVALSSFMFSEIFGGDKDFITDSVILTHLLALITVPALLSAFLA